MSFAKKLLTTVAIILIALISFVALGLAYLSVKEFRPDDIQAAELHLADNVNLPSVNDTIKLVTFNIGYGALGEESDFFMDGGADVRPESADIVQKNLDGIRTILSEADADIYLLQEVDTESKRSYNIDQRSMLSEGTASNAYAANFSCAYVPYPLPTIGKVDSGILTMTDYSISSAQRISLPNPFSWPVRIANLKRCLLVSYMPLEDSDSQLVVVNLHLEAYDSGEGKIEQSRVLMEFIESEYEKGNYVIAGGDFNCMFPGAQQAYPIKSTEDWMPGALNHSDLPEGFELAYDLSVPTCRLLNMPYNENNGDTQFYSIDGYIISPNLKLESVETLDKGFKYSDHHPVIMKISFKL